MDNGEDNEPAKILLVEDNPADVRIIKEIFKDFKTKIQLYVIKDGSNALDFLNKTGEYEEMPSPDLILLDLNLPRKSGRDLLREIRANKDFKNMPVIILTTSNTEKDILNAYELQVNCFITKPLDFNEYKRILQNIEIFWLKNIRLPSN